MRKLVLRVERPEVRRLSIIQVDFEIEIRLILSGVVSVLRTGHHRVSLAEGSGDAEFPGPPSALDRSSFTTMNGSVSSP